MLCGTPKTRHFSAFLSHFSKIIFEKRLIRQSQRLALLAAGGEPRSETETAFRSENTKKRGAYQPSSAPPENKDRPLSGKKLGRNGSILRSGRHISRTKQWRRTMLQSRGAPWFPVRMIHPLVAGALAP